MSSHVEKALDTLRPYVQSALSRLPAPAQKVLESPLVRKALLAYLAFAIIRGANRRLSKLVVNNWQRAEPWQTHRELVLVTGGCSGIGRAIMEGLAKTGVRVVIMDVQAPNFKLPHNVFFCEADVTSPASIRAVAKEIRAAHGDPTVLVNNAGIGHGGTILEEPEETIQATFQVNTVSHFWMVREFLPSMIRSNHGHVITIASMASFAVLGEMVDYCCSKASALAFHEGLSQELRVFYKAKKVRTSIVHPLWVRTPMIQQLTDAGQHFKQPVMTPEVVSAAVVKQILTQSSGQVILPPTLSWISYLRSFPWWLQEAGRSVQSHELKRLRDFEAEILGSK